MTEKLIKYYYPGTVVYLLIYYSLIFFNLKLGKEIISPVGVLFSFFVIFYVYKKTVRSNITWLILSLASLIWTFSDIYWATCEFILKLNPGNMEIFNILYLIPTILIMFAGFTYMKRFVRGINAVQLIIDITAISLNCFIMFWFIILKSSIIQFFKSIDNSILFIYIVCDFIILNLISIWFISMLKQKTNKCIHVTVFGVALYAVIDLVYSYLYFYNLYLPDSIIDTIYALSFIIIALGALHALTHKDLNRVNNSGYDIENIGWKARNIFLLSPIPLYILIRGFDFKIIIMFFLIFLIYKFVSNYVQNAINNEKLLEKEKEMTILLEEKVNDRTKELIMKNKELKYLSDHDFITNTYNTMYLKNYLDKIIDINKSKEQIIIFYMDVDRFKTINDTYGHDVGDSVLIEIANRLVMVCSSKHVLARIGVDEFVIVCEGNLDIKEIEVIAKKIIDECSKSIIIENYQFKVSLSIGISIFPKDGLSRISILKNADIAMYDSKLKGGNNYSLFNSYMSSMILEKHEIELLLRNADYNSEFNLVYQPQIDIMNNKLIGMEALIRWNSPTKGNIPPNKFIKIAEEVGCIERISEFVMNTAASQIGVWNRKYGQDLKMGINVSPNQLDSINFTEKLNETIKKYNLNPSWIDIEITENIAMKGEIRLEEIFSMLNNIDISTSIDDFGTGYSSLSYIQQFSFDRIKIAKELIDNITTDLNKKHIVKAIITMAEALNVVTIAEGVETKEQLAIMKELGCNQIQGYYFSKPLPHDIFEKTFLELAHSANSIKIKKNL